MTRSTRRLLFYCAVVIFLGVSYLVILYAQGYQYDFASGQFTRSGAIYLKANTSAEVYLNNKPVGNTSLLTNSGSVSGLLPGKYTIAVEKQGYFQWQKKIAVEAGLVDDFPHVMILPNSGQDELNVEAEIKNLLYPPTPSPSPSPTPLPKKTPRPTLTPSPSATPVPQGPYYLDQGDLYVSSADDGWTKIAVDVASAALSPDGQKLAWYTSQAPGQLWVYWLSDTNYQPVHNAGDIALIARLNSPIKALAWFRDNDHLAVDAGGYKVIETDTRGGLNIISF